MARTRSPSDYGPCAKAGDGRLFPLESTLGNRARHRSNERQTITSTRSDCFGILPITSLSISALPTHQVCASCRSLKDFRSYCTPWAKNKEQLKNQSS